MHSNSTNRFSSLISTNLLSLLVILLIDLADNLRSTNLLLLFTALLLSVVLIVIVALRIEPLLIVALLVTLSNK